MDKQGKRLEADCHSSATGRASIVKGSSEENRISDEIRETKESGNLSVSARRALLR